MQLCHDTLPVGQFSDVGTARSPGFGGGFVTHHVRLGSAFGLLVVGLLIGGSVSVRSESNGGSRFREFRATAGRPGRAVHRRVPGARCLGVPRSIVQTPRLCKLSSSSHKGTPGLHDSRPATVATTTRSITASATPRSGSGPPNRPARDSLLERSLSRFFAASTSSLKSMWRVPRLDRCEDSELLPAFARKTTQTAVVGPTGRLSVGV